MHRPIVFLRPLGPPTCKVVLINHLVGGAIKGLIGMINPKQTPFIKDIYDLIESLSKVEAKGL